MNKTNIIMIGDKEINYDRQVFVIAEAGVNHNGDINLAKKLVNKAADAGADAIKFQSFTSEKLVTNNANKAEYQGEGNQLEMLKKLELKLSDFIKLKNYSDEKGILFLSTPHTIDTVDFLDKIMPAFKISSSDITNIPLLEAVAKKNKPVILSTGMSTQEDIKEAVDVISKINKKIILLHCTTSYPCERKDVNLRSMETLKREFDFPVGFSDHTLGIDVPLMAAKIGAVLIEKHFTLDNGMEGPDHKASLHPDELKQMIQKLRSKEYPEPDEEVLGSTEIRPTDKEIEIAKIARKSIVAATDIPKGQTITKDMLDIKRPGTGIKPKKLSGLVGKKTLIDIKKDTLLKEEDIS